MSGILHAISTKDVATREYYCWAYRGIDGVELPRRMTAAQARTDLEILGADGELHCVANRSDRKIAEYHVGEGWSDQWSKPLQLVDDAKGSDMSNESVTTTIELTEGQAMALAQFMKRVGWDEWRRKAVDDAEAHLMRDACDKLSKALADRGFAPR